MNNYTAIKKELKVLDKELIDQGFTLTFDNGVLASVKFGFGSYSDEGKTTAEVAIIDNEDNWYVFDQGELTIYPHGSEVNARVTTDELADILYFAKQL